MTSRLPRAADTDLAACHTCSRVSPEKLGKCPRCGSPLHTRKPNSIRTTVALMLAAAALYVPANVLPIMTVVELGYVSTNTIVSGIQTFWRKGDYPIALVILGASIIIPLLKIIALVWLCLAASGKLKPSPGVLGKVYWCTELLGRWSMIDIFVVGILVALVQIGNYMTITPGPGALAFGAVVVLTMLAAMSFDPRLLWDRLDHIEAEASPTKHSNS